MTTDLLIALGKMNLAAAAAILAVILIRKPTRRAFGARMAYSVWLLVPLAAFAVLIPPRTITVTFAPVIDIVLPADFILDASAAAPVDVAIAPPTFALDPWLIAACLWFFGMAAMAAWLLRKQSEFVAEEQRGRAGPAVVGLMRPRIVTPTNFAEMFSDRERQVILAHETTHIARQDARANGLVALIRCVCWFNPLIHVGAHLMRIDQELACDAQVIARHPNSRRTYAEAMLKAELGGKALPLGCYWPPSSGHPLTERIAMLKHRIPGRARRIAGVVTLASLAAGAGFAAWAAQPERIERVQRPPEAQAALADQPPRTAPVETPTPLQPPATAPVEQPQSAPQFYVMRSAEAADYANLRALLAKEAEIAARQADLLKRYSEKHPDVQRALSERRAVQKQIADEIARLGGIPDGFVPVPAQDVTAHVPLSGGTPEPIEQPQAAPGGMPEKIDAPALDRTERVSPVFEPPIDRNGVPVFVPVYLQSLNIVDPSAPVSISGTVTDVKWVNPSTQIYVHDTAGKDWVIQSSTPNSLLRSGFTKDNLKAGVAITTYAHQRRDRQCAPACVIFAGPDTIDIEGLSVRLRLGAPAPEKPQPASASSPQPRPTAWEPRPATLREAIASGNAWYVPDLGGSPKDMLAALKVRVTRDPFYGGLQSVLQKMDILADTSSGATLIYLGDVDGGRSIRRIEPDGRGWQVNIRPDGTNGSFGLTIVPF